jgi:pyruvate carboxylase
VVGDLAQFMVQNELDEASVVEKADQLSFPASVVEFMQGYIGQPSFGFPEPLRSRVLKVGLHMCTVLTSGCWCYAVCSQPCSLQKQPLLVLYQPTNTPTHTPPPAVCYLQGKPTVEGRPGASMPPMELDNLEARLVERYGRSSITNKDVLSAALYPKVFEEYQSFVLRYSDLIEKLPTRAFLTPLKEDEEVEIELSKVGSHQGDCCRLFGWWYGV